MKLPITAMNVTIRLFVCCALVLGGLAGCATPGHRAKENPVAFHKLSPSDQRLVLKGKIRPGLDRDAVLIAWGPPDWKLQGGKGNEQCESWIYYRELTTYLPFNSYDAGWQTDDVLQPRFELGLHSFNATGGFGSSDFLYSPHVMLADIRFKRADFRYGKLHNFEVRHGLHHLTR